MTPLSIESDPCRLKIFIPCKIILGSVWTFVEATQNSALISGFVRHIEEGLERKVAPLMSEEATTDRCRKI